MKTKSSRSLYFTLFNSLIIESLRVSRSDKLIKSLSPIYISFPLFLTFSTSNSILLSDSSSNNFFSSLTVLSSDLVSEWPGIVMLNELFSGLILKKEFVLSRELTASIHLPSTKCIGEINEKVCVCLFILNSRVSWGRVFVCSIKISVCFSFKSNNSLFIYNINIVLLHLFKYES